LTRTVSAAVAIARSEPVAFFVLFVAGVALFAPGSVFTTAAGLAYGVLPGVVVSVGASIAAAAIHFAIVRHLLRGSARRRLRGHHRLAALDRAVAREGWKVVGLTRASAVIPGAVQNCLFALTRVPFRTFLVASAVGLIPPALVFATIGSTGAHVIMVGAGTLSEPSMVPVGLIVAGSLILVGAGWQLLRATRRELSKTMHGPRDAVVGSVRARSGGPKQTHEVPRRPSIQRTSIQRTSIQCKEKRP
jgi:uncharacterized membrane protein YdjX (TVP38/TMEM64 family)